jgi:aldehyde dehydrogenase (NAD+)
MRRPMPRRTEQAIAAARAAFPAWASFNVQARSDMLDKIGNEIIARKDELGQLLSREEGKTLPEGVGEVVRAGQYLQILRGRSAAQNRQSWSSRCAPVWMSKSRASPLVWSASSRRGISRRNPGVEGRACACVRQLRRVQTGRPRAGSAWALAEIISRAGARPVPSIS